MTEADFMKREIPLAKRTLALAMVDLPRVIVCGPRSGAGKSTLLGFMLREWALRNAKAGVKRRGLFLSAHKFVEGGFDLEKEWSSADLVALDDLGSEKKIASSLTLSFLEMRTSDAKPLWITTPCDEDGLAEAYNSESIGRRAYALAMRLPVD